MPQKVAHCHKKIAKLAKEACALHYEELMSSSNVVYQLWKKQHPGMTPKQLQAEFVRRHWGKCIDMARATLGLLLREPIDDKTKEDIIEILALDQTLIRGRQNPAVIMGEVKQPN